MTKDDIDEVLAVFTPDGTYSAFGDTYPLVDFPRLVAAAPKGLFLVGPPALDLDGDTGSGTQPLCFVDQASHKMRIGYYTDTYRRTAQGLAARHQVHDLPAAEREPGQRSAARPHPSEPERPLMDLEAFRSGLDDWLDAHTEALTPGGDGGLDAEMAHLATVRRLTYDAGWARWGWPTRVGGLGARPSCAAYLGEALTGRGMVEPGIYSMTETLAPTMIDYACQRTWPRPWSPGCSGRGVLVPGVLRAGCGQQSRLPLVPSGADRGRLAGHRPEGLDEPRPVRTTLRPARAHGLPRVRPPWHHGPVRRHGRARHLRPADRDHARRP